MTGIHKCGVTIARAARCALLSAIVATAAARAQQPISPEERADAVLNAGRLALNERNYPVAAERFRAYLKEFSGMRGTAAARYGLAIVLLEGPEKNYDQALEHLSQIDPVSLPERPWVIYYTGLAVRGQGFSIIDKAAGKSPQEQRDAEAAARSRFERAATHFAQAAKAFQEAHAAGGAPKTQPAGNEVPMLLEWAARSACDAAEMLIRCGRPKDVIAAVEPLTRDASLARSRYRNQALYLLGYAYFLEQQYLPAGKALAQLAPFNDPAIGVHARYLLARTHHMALEFPEAANGYEAVLRGYDVERKTAEKTLQNPEALKDRPDEKARLESLLRDPPPDYVVRAGFHLGSLLMEQGKYAEALSRFVGFLQQYPKSPLAADARLRVGVCQARLGQYNEAVRSLQPLTEHAALADQALLWLGRAQARVADRSNPQAYEQALAAAIQTLSRASEHIGKIAQKDPSAAPRRAEINMELADTRQMARQYKEAAALYARIAAEGQPPALAESALHKQAVALHLAGQFGQSDEVCRRFMSAYPKSAFLPDVMFRYAENAWLMAVGMSNSPGQETEQKRLYQEALARYQKLVEKFPDSPLASPARHGMGMAHYQLGHYAEALKALAAIPEPERAGELATVPYLMADCRLRMLPASAEDALSMARMLDQLNETANLLTAFASANENAPQAPDALIKIGYCNQRIAAVMVDNEEKRKALARARQAYATFVQKYTKHPLFAVAVYENAQCLAQLGDYATATQELTRFQHEPLRSALIAPLAMIRLGDYMRLRRPADAAALLATVKSQYEQSLLKDPSRSAWVALLNYTLGIALKDAGKFGEARAAFDYVAGKFPNSPEGPESLWRSAQVARDETLAQISAIRKAMASSSKRDPAKRQELDAAFASLRAAAGKLREHIAAMENKPELGALRMRMHYEAAWINRIVADYEIENAREAAAVEALRAFMQRTGREFKMEPYMIAARAAEIPLSKIPLQPAEKLVRTHYQQLIAVGANAELANDARFELGDLLARREEYDAAISVLAEAMDNDPKAELLDKLRLRLGGCHLAKGNAAAAQAQFAAILQNPKSPLAPHARCGLGECLMLQQDWAGAIKQLAPFRDSEPFRSAADAADVALLRLGQAYAQTGQWEPSRQAFEALINRYGAGSPWYNHARYGFGFALQNLKQYDQAIAAYSEVIGRSGGEVAARAQLQIGLCRLEQKRLPEALTALMAAAYTYDYPEITAAALCEAARVHMEMKQPEDARKVLKKVLQEFPQGKWHELASKRLADIK